MPCRSRRSRCSSTGTVESQGARGPSSTAISWPSRAAITCRLGAEVTPVPALDETRNSQCCPEHVPSCAPQMTDGSGPPSRPSARERSSPPRHRRILGGQSVQASGCSMAGARTRTSRRGSSHTDPAARAVTTGCWSSSSSARLAHPTVVLPLLVRGTRGVRCRPRVLGVVHVVSAGAAARIVVSRLLRRPVILNYHSGEALDHLTPVCPPPESS